MKTNALHVQNQKLVSAFLKRKSLTVFTELFIFVLIVLAICATASSSPAQVISNSENQASMKAQNDPLFPGRKKFNAGLISTYTGNTPPPVLIADVTYGISKKVSIGIVGGTTGALALYGIRVNTILLQQNNFRAVFRWNAIYYPGRDGKFLFDNSIKHVMPWMFTLGTADLEWKTKNGARWSLGAGYLETHCIDGMMKFFHLSNKIDEDDESPFQFYYVLHTGGSFPISKKLSLRPELVVVMRGLQPISKTADTKVSPFNPYLNVVYSFGR